MSDIFLSGTEVKYPEQLLDTRIPTEGNVISCLFKDMLLLDENVLSKDMFITKDCHFYFQMLTALRDKGFYNLDEVTIRSTFNEDFQKRFDELGGYETIQHQIDIISMENFEVYYDNLIKENMLLKMWDDHINLLKDIKVGDKTFPMLKYFRRFTSEQLAEFWEVRINDYGSVHSNKVLEEEDISFSDDFIDDCTMGMENGTPFDICGVDVEGNNIPGFKWLSNQIMGFLPGTFSAIGGFSNVGKALTMDSDILTVNGYKKMKDIEVGDMVFSDDGKAYPVTGVYYQGYKQCYRMTFNDKSTVNCCEDHLWNVITDHDKVVGNPYRTVSTKDMVTGKFNYKYKDKKDKYYKYVVNIPMTKPVEFKNEDELPLHPYALGVLIGDGCIVKSIKLTNPEIDVRERFLECLGPGFRITHLSSTREYELGVVDDYKGIEKDGRKRNRIVIALSRLGLLGKRGKDKFIPECYKYTTVENRIELLRGLIDTDGSVCHGCIEYSTTSEQLAKDVVFLVHTLGGVARYVAKKTRYTKKDGSKSKEFDSYKVFIRVNNDLKLFTSKKHLSRDIDRKKTVTRRIQDIEDIGMQECQCISIGSPSHLYLTNNCVVTHNTTVWTTVTMGLVHRGEKVLIISNEESSTKFKSKFLVWILYNHNRYYKLTKAKLLSGNITDEDREQIKIAQDYWEKNCKGKVKFISIEDADISVVKKKVRENVLKYGFTTVIYDTMKLDESAMGNQRTDLSLVRDSRELHRLAKKYNLIMLASIQLAEHSRGQLALNASVLSNSKQIKEILENLILVRSVYSEELDKENKKYYCEPYKINKVDNKWIREEYDLDPDAVYKMVYIDKARSGKNSEDTASCFLYKFIGDYSTFREACWCKIKHGQII